MCNIRPKLVLSYPQKLYLILYYGVQIKYLEKKLELLKYENTNNELCWSLTDSKKQLGHYFSSHVYEELTSTDTIVFEEIYNNQDLDCNNYLIGTFYINGKKKDQITLSEAFKLRKANVKEGASYYYDLKENKKYVIIRGNLWK